MSRSRATGILFGCLALGLIASSAAQTPNGAPGPPPQPESVPQQPVIDALPPVRFTAEQALQARKLCVTGLSGENLEGELLAPIEGEDGCGLAAPIKLTLIGVNSVAINPAATVGCPLGRSLARWADTVLQPLARTHFDEEVVELTNVSSYVCRRRYRRPGARLSEHARGNALDVAAFTFKSGRKISVLDHWQSDGEDGLFLRQLHARSCGPFGTVLGPDANDAHKNHFHLDGKEQRAAYCE